MAAISLIPMNPPGFLDWKHIESFMEKAQEGRSLNLKVYRVEGHPSLQTLGFFEGIWDYITRQYSDETLTLLHHSVRKINVRARKGGWTTLAPDALCRRVILAQKYNRMVQALFADADWPQIHLPGSLQQPSLQSKHIKAVDPQKMQPFFRDGRFFNRIGEGRFEHLSPALQVGWKVARERGVEIYHERDKGALRRASEVLPRSDNLVMHWIGHSTVLIQMGNVNILTDPIFGDLAAIEKRRADPGIALDALPVIDVLLISHNHRDHLEESSILKLKKYQPLVCVPAGLQSWFRKRGFTRVQSHGWWTKTQLRTEGSSSDQPVVLTSVPAWHWSQRKLLDQNKSLWGGWVVSSRGSTVYFAGDTAYNKEMFEQIGETVRHIDLALMPIGPCGPEDLVRGSHMGPEEALQAFKDLKAELFVPIHWGTFRMGTDDYDEPLRDLNKFLQDDDALTNQVCLLHFGERFSLENLAADSLIA